MRLFLFLFILFFVAAGCSEDMPSDILSKEKMAAVKWDMMQADEMVYMYHAADTNYPSETKRLQYYAEIYRIHKTSREQFDKSLDYYTARPKLLREIMDSIQRKGEKIQSAPTRNIAVADTSSKLRSDSNARSRNLSADKRATDSVRKKKFLRRP